MTATSLLWLDPRIPSLKSPGPASQGLSRDGKSSNISEAQQVAEEQSGICGVCELGWVDMVLWSVWAWLSGFGFVECVSLGEWIWFCGICELWWVDADPRIPSLKNPGPASQGLSRDGKSSNISESQQVAEEQSGICTCIHACTWAVCSTECSAWRDREGLWSEWLS